MLPKPTGTINKGTTGAWKRPEKTQSTEVTGVILSVAVFQAERRACPEAKAEGISRVIVTWPDLVA